MPLSKNFTVKKGASRIFLTSVTFVCFAEKNSQGDKHKILSAALVGAPQEVHYSGTSSASGGPRFNSTHPSF